MLFSKITRKIKETTIKNKLVQASRNLNNPRSVFFFTTHKCASTFVGTMFDVILRNSEYKLIDYASMILQLGDKLNPGSTYEVFLEKSYSDLYSLHGKIYAPQRKYLDFPGRNKFKHIFFLRDPRDVLVSAYYSFGFTHSEPTNTISLNNFTQRRKKIQDQEIDDYVLEQAEAWIVPLYKQYKDLRETAEAYIYIEYDLFTKNTPEFIKQISQFLELHISNEDIELLTRKANPVQKTETMTHKRSGRTGQYLEKLQPQTIDKLNHILSEVLFDWQFKV